MKRIKILVGSLALVAIAGTTLAFEASKFSSLFVFQKPSPTATTCPLVTSGILKTTAAGGTQYTNAFTKTNATPPAASLCTVTYRITAE